MEDVRFDAPRWFAQVKSAGPDDMQRNVLATAPANPLPHGVHGVQALRLLTQDAAYQLK
jgi:hypothetical protein